MGWVIAGGARLMLLRRVQSMEMASLGCRCVGACLISLLLLTGCSKGEIKSAEEPLVANLDYGPLEEK